MKFNPFRLIFLDNFCVYQVVKCFVIITRLSDRYLFNRNLSLRLFITRLDTNLYKIYTLIFTGKVMTIKGFITHNSTSSANYYDSYVIQKRRKLYKIFLCKHPECVISRRFLKRRHYSNMAANIASGIKLQWMLELIECINLHKTLKSFRKQPFHLLVPFS